MYFDHSTTAATDPKVMQLRLEMGGAAVDAYWYLLEQMHRDERGICVCDAGALRVHCHTLCTGEDELKTWVSAMVSIGLFEQDPDSGEIISPRAAQNIETYKAKSEKARSSAKARWENADAKRPHKRAQSGGKQNAMLTKQNKTKGSSALKSTTTLPATGGAAAAGAAPAVAAKNPVCPLCQSKLYRNKQTAKWECPTCYDTFTDEQIGGGSR